MARESLSIALNRASSCRWPLWRAAPTARPSTRLSMAYGVIVVAKASVRLPVSLLVCTKNDLNTVPSFASPW
jgi:hypothetical protein